MALQKIHDLDVSQNMSIPTRICPKITDRHINLDNFSKMSVKLATHVYLSGKFSITNITKTS